MEEKKKLYVFFYHVNSDVYVHSLYALDLPAPDDTTPTIPEVTTTITITTVLGATSTVNTTETVAQGEPERKSIEPILRFCTPNWGRGMTCARLDKKLYLLGGMRQFYTSMFKRETEYPRDVSILDLSSSSLAEDYRDQPRTNMPMGPSMLQGKIEPVISFFADGELYVLSGCDTCMHTGKKFKQFEILRNNQWMYGDDPPFNDLLGLSYVIVNGKVIITGTIGHACGIWEYDLKLKRWTEFDKSCWIGVDENTFFQGSQMIYDTLWTLGHHIKTGMPIVIPFKYKNMEKRRRRGKEVERNGEDEEEEEVKFFEVVPYKIKSLRLSDTLTCVGDRTLCYVQVGPPTPPGDPAGFNAKECYLSVTQFAVDGESAKHLNCAHYKMFPDGCNFNVMAAYFV